MSDAPERIWAWKNDPHGETVVSGPDNPYPTGAQEYVRADLFAALEAERDALVKALTIYSCEDGCNDCPMTERDRVSCGRTAFVALTKIKGDDNG